MIFCVYFQRSASVRMMTVQMCTIATHGGTLVCLQSEMDAAPVLLIYTRVFLEKSDWMTSRSKLLTHSVLWEQTHAGSPGDWNDACHTKRAGQPNKSAHTHTHTYTPRTPRAHAPHLCTFSHTDASRNCSETGRFTFVWVGRHGTLNHTYKSRFILSTKSFNLQPSQHNSQAVARQQRHKSWT